MSHDAIQWAIHGAPTATTAEFAVVVALGEKAGPDGCGAFPSRSWLAERTKLDPKVVQKTLAELNRRGVIISGDQSLAEYIRADRRPPVWDLAIPAAWYEPGRLAKINQNRAVDGLEPLTTDNRPPLAPAPEKARRKDLGKAHRKAVEPDPEERASDELADESGQSGAQSANEASRGVLKTPREEVRGVSETPREAPRGVSKTRTGGLQNPHGGSSRPPNLKEEPKTESLSGGDTSERPGEPRPTGREREDFGKPETLDPAGLIVQAWIESWATTYSGAPHPVKAPDAIRRDARELLAEGKDDELLRLAAADMATHGWISLPKHLEHWKPPAQPAQHASGTTPRPCPWCKYGWYETQNGGELPCRHPEHPPPGHPAAADNRSAA